ncbi:conserved membrane hypothetical protein [Gammaproteobacteria bacterium]
MKALLLLLLWILPSLVLGEETHAAAGEARVPLGEYTQLLEQVRHKPRPALADYALGSAAIQVEVTEEERRTSARVTVTLAVETFAAEWILVPILPQGTALAEATLDGKPVSLVPGPDGLSWNTRGTGAATLQLRYGIDAQRSERGYSLAIPVPRAAATRLQATLPGKGLDVAVVPSADLRITEAGDLTQVTATMASSPALMITWRVPGKETHVLSRARYHGELGGEAVLWNTDFDVELNSGEQVTLPLMSVTTTLSDMQVDGKPAKVLVEKGHFATTLQGRGSHRVSASFQVPLSQEQGPPQVSLTLPRVPVSHFELVLPGKKEVKVTPRTPVVATESDGRTRAEWFLPMADSAVFSWVDTVPEDLRTSVRANATLYHTVRAEEGVLHVRGLVDYEMTHGETGQLELELPAEAQVNRITTPTGAVSDWAVATGGNGRKQISVFLDRPVKGAFRLDLSYERLLGTGAEARAPVTVPLLRAVGVHRQRGMVALLAGTELSLEPVEDAGLSRVGENQLPGFVRNDLAGAVAHTYKYTDEAPPLSVRTLTPEREQGKFDASVDTLVSVGDVTMKGSATVQVDVKSGTIMALALSLPGDVNVLGVSGPSIRTHRVSSVQGRQHIDIAFTQEMDGQFRIEVHYERITSDSETAAPVPTVSVSGAEVEHGRIAVEALSAVEIKPATARQLSTLDINELPQQLVLKTTNPILLAYKYVYANPPFQLALSITRHKEIDVQEAIIEQASYRTLLTRDGLAVTAASYRVRNTRRQFLRLALPARSEVWSVFVNGAAEKPAQGSDEGVLVKMISSASGFPVELVYAQRVPEMGMTGTLSGHLPRPDMVVTHTRWDLFLPARAHYWEPESSMDLVAEGTPVNPRAYAADALEGEQARGQPLRISVPSQGVHFAFEKLYANRGPELSGFRVRYAVEDMVRLGQWLSVVGVLLVWLGIVALSCRCVKLSRAGAVASLVVGAAAVYLAIGYLGAKPAAVSTWVLGMALALGAWRLIARIRAWKQQRAVQDPV